MGVCVHVYMDQYLTAPVVVRIPGHNTPVLRMNLQQIMMCSRFTIRKCLFFTGIIEPASIMEQFPSTMKPVVAEESIK